MRQITLRAKEAFLLNLKMIMAQRDLTQKDLAEMLDCSKQQISNIFNGENNLSLNTTEKIAAALNVDETDLFNPNLFSKLKKQD